MTSQPHFSATIKAETVEFSLHEKRGIFSGQKSLPTKMWESKIPESYQPILAIVNGLVEEFGGSISENEVTLPHEAIVGLTDTQAHILGLPLSIPFAFDLRSNGMIDQSDFSLTTSWVNAGGIREHNVTRQGAFVTQQGVQYRIPSPIYEIVRASELLTASNSNEAESRYQALNRLQELLPKSENKSEQSIKPDRYLDSIRIMHASAFSLQIPTDGDDFRFNPVLFSRKAVGRAQENDRFLDEAENLLTPKLQSVFANDRFTRWGDVRDCYAVDDGVYVYIDQDLRKALTVVRRIQQSDAAERKKFIRSPHRAIKEFFRDDPNVEAIDRLFVETEQYAENVIGLGIWQPPVIPWVVRQPNSWLPEKFGLKIGATYVQIKPEDVASVREEISKRITAQGFSEPEQEPFNYEGVNIPITQEALDGLEKISSVITPKINNTPVGNQQQEDEIIKLMPHFLLVEDNLENVCYQVRPQRRSPSPNHTLPVVLKSTLKIHQTQGLKWLINSWTEGAPGVLLADDMGLGKTLQALTFLAWLKERNQEGHARCKEPVLIVAPTALLNNWQREINIHLREPYLGEICEAYGGGLSVVRTAGQNDLTTGQINLSRDHIRRFDVVLTTYETYRDYHHSFGGIRFSAAVLDECQKIKNPKSQVNRALASMNAEFVIAMTGTPVENAMEDLWTILDRTWPGFLGDLKSFSSAYPPDNQESLSKLTHLLKGAAATDVPSPIMLRRMKEDILDDLPRKIIHPDPKIATEVGILLQSDMVTHMPPEQANAYLDVVNHALEETPPPKLFIIHKLRGISLHPVDPDSVLSTANFASYDKYIAGSARLTKCIQILDSIQKKNEKVLIFIETISMQNLMAEIIKKRYKLAKRPDIINGKTGAERIQRFVDEFQNDFNFDVMILSPKVGGVGLTLTAANHVIHLSRWWNPAVEDQSTDRVYRIGQKKDVHVYYPMAVHPETHILEKSFDLELNALLARKRKLSRDMLIPSENASDADSLFNEIVGFSRETPQTTIEELDRMDGIGFESWALTSAKQSGYIADGTKTSWDKGSDGVIRHKETGLIFILQCKHSNRPKIEEDKVIYDLLEARAAYEDIGDATLVALTNSYFAPRLLKRMDELKIRHFDRDSICKWPQL